MILLGDLVLLTPEASERLARYYDVPSIGPWKVEGITAEDDESGAAPMLEVRVGKRLLTLYPLDVTPYDGFRFMVCLDGGMQGDRFPVTVDEAYAKAREVYDAEHAAGNAGPLVTIVLIGPEEWAREYAVPTHDA